jgi:hypothetical protein
LLAQAVTKGFALRRPVAVVAPHDADGLRAAIEATLTRERS